MPFHRKLLFSLLESSHHGELLDSISWRTINSRELLVPLISSGGVFPLTRLYQITHGSGGWEKLQERSDGGAKRQSEERTDGSGADGDGGDEVSLENRLRTRANLPLLHIRRLAPLCAPAGGRLSRPYRAGVDFYRSVMRIDSESQWSVMIRSAHTNAYGLDDVWI